MGHKTIYPVDEEGDFPWGRVVNYAKANGMAEKFSALDDTMGRQVKEQDEFMHFSSGLPR
jgi:hypothetical protein